jgi:hypothetical protein
LKEPNAETQTLSLDNEYFDTYWDIMVDFIQGNRMQVLSKAEFQLDIQQTQ